jgi:hypothetical protein
MNFVEETLLELKKEYGWTKVQLERALDLNPHDLDNTENPEIIALMKMIKTFPWLVNVAERKFDQVYANQMLHKTAQKILKKEVYKKNKMYRIVHNSPIKGILVILFNSIKKRENKNA